MATYSTGITCTWLTVTFGEVTGLTWSYGGSMPKGRGVNWTDDAGTVTVTCLSAVGISAANYGLNGTLTITGGGADLTVAAVYVGLSVTPELNGVTRYSVTFKILN